MEFVFEVNPKNLLSSKEINELDNKDREYNRSKHRKFLSDNPGISATYNERYRTKKAALPCTLTHEEWNNIKDHFNNKCAYCGSEKPLAQDHFIALDKCGEFTINNVIPACKSCNSSKHNKDFFNWYPRYKHYNKDRERKILRYLNYKGNVQQLSLIQ